MKPHSHLLPSPPTLLIQDLRLHMAFLLFTASHSRRWPAGQGEGEPMLLKRSSPHRGCFLVLLGRPPLDSAQRSNAKEQAVPTTRARPPLTRWALRPTSRQFFSKWTECLTTKTEQQYSYVNSQEKIVKSR